MQTESVGLRRHLAAVMFTDMAGYTAMMQRDESEALRSRSRHREALELAVTNRGGRVLQYFGDGSLSLFLSSVEAANAAIEIQRTLERKPLVRIGLHLGDVAYDEQGAYGDAINIAARLEALARPGGVLISSKVFDEIQAHPELKAVHIADVRLKNIRGSVRTYALVVDDGQPEVDTVGGIQAADPGVLPTLVQARMDERALPGRAWAATDSQGAGTVPLIGRAREMDTLRSLVAQVEGGHGTTVFVRGGRGVGKTRLAEAAAAYVQENGWTVLNGRAYASEARVPYAPFSNALLPVLKGLDADELASIAPGGVDAIAGLFPALGIGTAGAGTAHLAADERRARLFWHLSALLGRLSEHRPILLNLEDLDFADQSSLELLHFVSRHCPESRILVMCQYTGLDDDQRKALLSIEASLKSDSAVSILAIQPLTESETTAFVAESLESSPESVAEISSRLFQWTGGVPLFLEGTIRGLLDEEHLVMRDGNWSAADVSAAALPESVRDAVLKWTARLSEAALSVADLLAVAGTQMTHEALATVSLLDESDFVDAIDELLRSQVFAESESEWTLQYDFRHPLIRETLRRHLSPGTQRRLHGRIADALEDHYGDSAGSHAEELAYHFGQASPGKSRAKAIKYLARAGSNALAQHANQEAAAHFSEALERLETAPGGSLQAGEGSQDDRPPLVIGLAKARRRLGEIEDSLDLLKPLLPEARDSGRWELLATVHREIGLSLIRGGRFDEALDHLREGVSAATEADSVGMRVRIQLAQGLCLHTIGRPAEARQVLGEALNGANGIDDPILLARAHNAVIQIFLFQGAFEESRAHAETALRLAERSGAASVVFWSHWAMGVLAGLIGDSEDMLRRIEATERLAGELGFPSYKCESAELAVQLAYTSGDWGRGIEIGEKAADLARSTGQRTVLPRLLAWLSLIYIGRGDFETARSATEEAWQVARADRAADHLWPTDVHVVVPAHIAVAALHLALGEWRDAIRVAQAGLSIADRSGYVVWAVHHLLPLIAEAALNLRELDLAADTGRRMRAEAEAMGHALGLAWADACDAILTWLESDPVQGAASLRTGVDALESIPLKYEAARLRRQLAGRLFEAGDPAAAALELAGALALFRRLGADPEIERAYRQYEEMGLAAPKPEEGSEPLP